MFKYVEKVSEASRNLLFRGLSTTAAAVAPDEEQGIRPAATHEEVSRPGSSPQSPVRNVTDIRHISGDLISAEDKLQLFRTLTGIDTAPLVTRNGHAVRTAANIGIYTRVVRSERWTKKAARSVSILSSLCLALQIIMGAAVTAAAASRAPYTNITALGACATITASIVAYIRGSGQPDKLRQEESRWKWVREYIEQREREFCLADSELDAYEEVRTVEQMFREVKEEIEGDGQGGDGGGCDCPCKSGDQGHQAMPKTEEVIAQVFEPEGAASGAREKAPE